MLSYPLCPFFVVFCNVVGTSNAKDFQLLEDVTDDISTLVTENKFVNRLHRLCATLLVLCKPLVRPSEISAHPQASATAFGVQSTMHTSSVVPNAAPNPPDMSNANDASASFVSSSWNDDMMWQLFQSQPSLDWFNADILDPTWDVPMPK
jgi:hypothetical protein